MVPERVPQEPAPRFAVSPQKAEPVGELPILPGLEARPPELVPAREREPERPGARPVQQEVLRMSDHSPTAAR